MSGAKSPVLRPTQRVAAGIIHTLLFLFILSLCLHVLFDLLPEAAIQQAGAMAVDPDFLQSTRDRLGVSGPWYQRLLEYWRNLLRGDAGTTVQGGYPILSIILQRSMTTLVLAGLAGGLVILLPVPLASLMFSLDRRGRGWRHAVVGLMLTPQFLSCTILYASMVLLLGGTSTQSGSGALVRWSFAVMSVAAMPFTISYLAASSALRQASQERFVDTYRMLGMSQQQIRSRLIRNAWVSIRPLTSRMVLVTIMGVIFAELLFGMQGIGSLFIDALRTSDLNLMRTLMLLAGAVVLVASAFERSAS